MNLPYLDPAIVNHLRKKLPPKEYQESQQMTPEQFLAESAYRAGQRNLLDRLDKIVRDQENGR